MKNDEYIKNLEKNFTDENIHKALIFYTSEKININNLKFNLTCNMTFDVFFDGIDIGVKQHFFNIKIDKEKSESKFFFEKNQKILDEKRFYSFLSQKENCCNIFQSFYKESNDLKSSILNSSSLILILENLKYSLDYNEDNQINYTQYQSDNFIIKIKIKNLFFDVFPSKTKLKF